MAFSCPVLFITLSYEVNLNGEMGTGFRDLGIEGLRD
jgi:hypothetical protein